MAARFTALASGSAGNACLIQTDEVGVLIDFGLGPRTLASRLSACGLSWRDVDVVLLTHTHGDHWRETTLLHLVKLGRRLFCHAAHAEALSEQSDGFGSLHAAGLVTIFESGRSVDVARGLTAIPLPISHDAGATFGFRFEGSPDLFGPGWALGYAADLGCWDIELARSLADVDLLAVEFNHDEYLQKTSGRPPFLIERVLGDQGHLSNRQAKGLLTQVISESTYKSPRQVIPLHLSRECNRPDLARTAATEGLMEADQPGDVIVALQDEPGPTLMIERPCKVRSRRHPAA